VNLFTVQVPTSITLATLAQQAVSEAHHDAGREASRADASAFGRTGASQVAAKRWL